MILHINSKKELNEAIASNKNLVVDFYADWCGPCKMLGRVIEDIEANRLSPEVTFAKINVDANNDLARKFSVFSIPSVYFFKDGKQTPYLENGQSKPFMLGACDEDALLSILRDTFSL